ncbi:MAG: hypothetical protein QOD32_3493 [Pyrinomonadaceae bacterium]|jgi:hypothetical protein|nr:hypothetical protein [Pyrinomonadaceae bacterium]
MSTNESSVKGAGAPVAKDAPTEQQASQAGAPKRFERGQTVCNEKNEKGKLCNGHLKQVSPVGEEARQHMRGDDLLYRCQTCGARYMGPPLGHVRDPRKQARYVQSELVAILEAAGGTLPAFKQNEAGAWIPAGETTSHAHAPVAAAAQNIKPVAPVKATPPVAPAATGDAPSGETPEEKRARIIAEAKAKAAARMAGGGAPAPGTTPAATSPTAASPAAAASGDAPDGETADERRARMMAEVKAKAAARMAAKGGAPAASDASGATTASPAATQTTDAPVATQTTDAPVVNKTTGAPPAAVAAAPSVAPEGETADEKRARQMAEIKAKAAARMAAKSNSAGGAKTGGETSIATPPTTAQPPSPTSGTDSSAAADAHRPAAEAQAATGQASAAPLSPAAATASPAAGAETVADLAPDASTELTPGAPRDERATTDDQ